MKYLRPGFLKGALRHVVILPRLIFSVRGWPWLLADCVGLRRSDYQVRWRTTVCELRPGTSDWWIFLEIFVFAIYRRGEGDIGKAEVIMDIGSNVGFFALYGSELNPKAQIHAFEPFPANLAQVEKNAALNPRRNVRAYPYAVSDKSGTVKLYFTPGDESGCSLNWEKGQFCEVRTIRPDELFATCGVTQCDLLKMDCEGSELAIMKSISPAVLGKIRTVIMEYHDPAQVNELREILGNAGFRSEVLPQINTLYASRS